MFKIMKWSAAICAVALFSSWGIAQAGKRPPLKSRVQQSAPPAQGAKHRVTVSENAEATAAKTLLASTVDELDKDAKGWNSSGFEWAPLYSFFSTYMSTEEFVRATQSGNAYSNIDSLAKILHASKNMQTETMAAAKFYVYSALDALYHRCDDEGQEDMNGFEFLQEANASIYLHKPNSVEYHDSELTGACLVRMLRPYKDYFTDNTNITRLELKNSVSDLITVINARANVNTPDETVFTQKEAIKRPTVKEVLEYYPDEQEVVFAFLVRYPMETEEMQEGAKPRSLKSETLLKQKISHSFNTLWKSIEDEDGFLQLANIAIHLFGMNPLNPMYSASQAQNPHSATVSHRSEPTINWAHLRAAKITETVIISFYVELVQVLRAEQAANHLYSQKCMSGESLEMLRSKSTNTARSQYLFDHIINPALSVGFTETLRKLLEYMSNSKNEPERELVQQIYTKLSQELN